MKKSLLLVILFSSLFQIAEAEYGKEPPLAPLDQIKLAIREEIIAQNVTTEELKLCEKSIKRHSLNAGRKIATPGRPAPYGSVTWEQHRAAQNQLSLALGRQKEIQAEMEKRQRTIIQLKELNVAYKEKMKRGESIDGDLVDLDIQKARSSGIGKTKATEITR